MANRAVPKKRREAAAKKATGGKGVKIERGVKAAKGKRAKAGVANGEREDMAPSNVTRETVEHHAQKIFGLQAEVTEAAEALKTIRADLSGAYKSAKNDGVNTEAVKEVARLRKMDPSEVRTKQRDVRRYMSILVPETAKQLDMFVDWRSKAVDADADGYAAFKNNEPITNVPFKAGSAEAQEWQAGWKRGETDTIRSMGPAAKRADATIQ